MKVTKYNVVMSFSNGAEKITVEANDIVTVSWSGIDYGYDEPCEFNRTCTGKVVEVDLDGYLWLNSYEHSIAFHQITEITKEE